MSRRDAVLVTGASGFLGAWIVSALLRAGKHVVALDLATDSRRLDQLMGDAARDGLRWVSGDVRDTDAVDRMVGESGAGTLIHLAALVIPACRQDPIAGAQVNVVGHLNVLEAAQRHGVSRVIYTSSIAAKPRGPDRAPANLYGVFKKTNEEVARLYWQERGLASLGLRPYIVYGVGRDEGETSVFTAAMRAAALDQAYTLPYRTRSCFQYAGDVAEMVRLCSDADWQGALVSDLSEDVRSSEDVVAAIRAAVPAARIDLAETERPSPSSGFDTEPLRGLIGDRPATSLEDGVAATIDAYRRLAAA